MIRVFIADDHAIVRDGLKRILSEESGMEVVGEAGNGKEALRLLRKTEWDFLLLDVSMPDMGGLDVLKRVLLDNPRKKVLILTQHEEGSLALRFLNAGAAGYLTKLEAADELVKAIHKIMGGKRYVAAGVAEELVGEINSQNDVPLHNTLSDREYGVLCKIANGASLSTIASELNITVSTVSTYRRRILNKLNLSSNSDLTRYALEKGLVE
ncbi:MAG: response regulator transcription factor [Magnetococcales bacterium]|nr:response regulator transcription factor [Magnetococcales bacterium]